VDFNLVMTGWVAPARDRGIEAVLSRDMVLEAGAMVALIMAV
jgi:hypothetical protein